MTLGGICSSSLSEVPTQFGLTPSPCNEKASCPSHKQSAQKFRFSARHYLHCNPYLSTCRQQKKVGNTLPCMFSCFRFTNPLPPSHLIMNNANTASVYIHMHLYIHTYTYLYWGVHSALCKLRGGDCVPLSPEDAVELPARFHLRFVPCQAVRRGGSALDDLHLPVYVHVCTYRICTYVCICYPCMPESHR